MKDAVIARHPGYAGHMITIVRLTLIVVLLFAARGSLADAPLIQTSNGTVRGSSDEGINAFRGIPYAAPPVGPPQFQYEV